MSAIRTVCILASQSLVGCIFVDHRVHASWCNAKEKPRLAQLAEVTVVAVPVWLWNNGHLVACSLKGAAYNGSSE